jgi:hypothetical protein
MTWNLNFIKGVGNHHIDVSRLLWFVAAIAAVVLTAVHLIRDHAFSIIEFGTGMGILNGGSAAGTALKDTAVGKVVAGANQDGQ